MKYPEVKTLQIGHKLLIVDGRSTIKYLDLRNNKVKVYDRRNWWQKALRVKVKPYKINIIVSGGKNETVS
jgi:hypothetical protein